MTSNVKFESDMIPGSWLGILDQVIPILDTLPSDLVSRRSRVASSNRRRAQEEPYSDFDEWLGPKLREWSSTSVSSLLMVQSRHYLRFGARATIGDLVGYLDQKQVAVACILRPITQEDSINSAGPTTVIDALKSLVLQTLRSPQARSTKSQSKLIVDAILGATTAQEWTEILSLCLNTLSLVYVLVDSDGVHRNQAVDTADTSIQRILGNLVQKQNQRNETAIVKIMIVWHGPGTGKLDGESLSEKATLVRAQAPMQRKSRRPRGSGLLQTLSPYIVIPEFFSTDTIGADRSVMQEHDTIIQETQVIPTSQLIWHGNILLFHVLSTEPYRKNRGRTWDGKRNRRHIAKICDGSTTD